MVAFSDSAVAYWAQLGRSRLLWHSLDVAPHRLVVCFVERVQFHLQPWDVPLGLLVVHPEPDLVYFVAYVPKLFLSDVAVAICQYRLLYIGTNNSLCYH